MYKSTGKLTILILQQNHRIKFWVYPRINIYPPDLTGIEFKLFIELGRQYETE